MMSDEIRISKGLELPAVALDGVGHMPANWEDEKESARGCAVAATFKVLILLNV
jgi:hypothetical protein